jgi:alginate O-acetyltransferase complex protein AlgI
LLFNSIEFIVFFGLIFVLYWLGPLKWRWVLLLAASYFFYMSWEPIYIVLILISTAIDYFLCRYMTGTDDARLKKIGLTTSIILNLSLLFSFKYLGFFQQLMQEIFHSFGAVYHASPLQIILPVGISFYTFQTISYSIDVYRGNLPAERHFGKFALFVSFFPQLVAGPIERAGDLLPQVKRHDIKLQSEDLRDGILMFLWGLFKKVVVADHAAMFVDNYYASYSHQSGGFLLFATYMFAVQIYCDFSGYSDMAIGIARMLGIRLMDNFKTPYFSPSMTSFWRNWHVSLSTWLKDYLYIPLGGNKGNTFRTSLNLMTTMVLGGLWHGANWTFIVWGALNGFFLAIEKLLHKLFRPRGLFMKGISIFIVFHLVCLGWIFFRSQTIAQALIIIEKIIHLQIFDLYFMIADNRFSSAILGTLLMLFIELQIPFQPFTALRKKPLVYRYTLYIIIATSVLLLGVSGGAQFIYFQF